MESAKYEISEVPINEYSWHMNLKILNVQKHDFGSYVCASVNALGKVEGDVRLQGKLVYYTHPQDRITVQATPVFLCTWWRYIKVAGKCQNWKFLNSCELLRVIKIDVNYKIRPYQKNI